MSDHARRAPAARYSARWSNGAWKIFDHMHFADVGTAVTQRLARDAAAQLNIGGRK